VNGLAEWVTKHPWLTVLLVLALLSALSRPRIVIVKA
jgi:hypothetical protein